MTSIKRLLSALFWAICFSSASNAQVDTTGNLINNNSWSGVTYGVDPNDCCSSISGSGPLYDTNTDTILFSYGQSTVSQTIGINQALGGTGIQVQGYNFSWEFRYISNNTTQNDSLVFNVALRDSSGSIVESQNYSLDGMAVLYDAWYTSSNTYSYNNPYLDPQSITLNISGRDGGFWAGYYGPEVRNVSLSVNYSFDPCAADPLYSSSCPGYWEAWFEQFCLFWCNPEPEIEIATVNYTLTPTTSVTSSVPEESTTGEVKVDAGGIEISTTGELSVPDGIPEEAKEKKPVDMNLIMSIVREATDDSKALEVVNQSIQDSIAEDANPNFTGISLTGELLENDLVASIFMRGAFSSMATESTSESIEDTSTSSTDTTSLTNVTSEIKVEQNTESESTETVKQNVQPNDAAGDVDISSIAVQPIGFNDYLTKNLIDSRFYEEKEIYTGQTIVDNRRAQRLLSGASDRLHQEMVNQQYRR